MPSAIAREYHEKNLELVRTRKSYECGPEYDLQIHSKALVAHVVEILPGLHETH